MDDLELMLEQLTRPRHVLADPLACARLWVAALAELDDERRVLVLADLRTLVQAAQMGLLVPEEQNEKILAVTAALRELVATITTAFPTEDA